MKTIITVIFAGILTYTGAQHRCQVPTGLRTMGREFSTNSFFKGSWYVTHMKDVTSNSYDAVCREYKTKVEDKKMKLETNEDYTIKKVTKPYTTTCSADIPPMQHGSIHLRCQHSGKDGNSYTFIDFSLLWTIIETDYQGYALAYRCTRYDDGSIHIGNLLLLQRTKTADTSKATEISKKYSMQKLC
uniref:Salivary lipocalin n=1 Tax=Triatoma brasiliensis TaxID=65344 RepID=A0MK92_TRIBS|nr:salivary lipocalin [Triatoma brasiliensis]